MSKAPPRMPIPCCTLGAVPGTMPSGVVVASTRWSISSAVRPAQASAACAASMARPDVVPPMWRSRIPVRSTIHSSLVSRLTAMSSLVTTLSGTAMPQPVIRIPFTRRSGADGVDADEPRVPVDDAAGVDRHPDACPGDLAGARPAAELRGQLDHLGQPRGPQGMPAADQAAAGVDDQPGRVDAGGAGLGGRTGLPGAKKPSDSRA